MITMLIRVELIPHTCPESSHSRALTVYSGYSIQLTRLIQQRPTQAGQPRRAPQRTTAVACNHHQNKHRVQGGAHNHGSVAHLINQSTIVGRPEPMGVSGVQDLEGGYTKGQVPVGAPGRLHRKKVLLDSLLIPPIAHDNIHEAACSALTVFCDRGGWLERLSLACTEVLMLATPSASVYPAAFRCRGPGLVLDSTSAATNDQPGYTQSTSPSLAQSRFWQAVPLWGDLELTRGLTG